MRYILTALVLAVGTVFGSLAAFAADDDIIFRAVISAEDQSIPTESPGTGFAEIRLERATLKITWKVTFKDLTSPPTIAGQYGPENVGGNAGQIVNLAPNGKITSPLEGSTVLSDGSFQYLITSRVYVNIHTTKYKDGELRGQLRRQRK